jgi:hypothetical protein
MGHDPLSQAPLTDRRLPLVDQRLEHLHHQARINAIDALIVVVDFVVLHLDFAVFAFFIEVVVVAVELRPAVVVQRISVFVREGELDVVAFEKIVVAAGEGAPEFGFGSNPKKLCRVAVDAEAGQVGGVRVREVAEETDPSFLMAGKSEAVLPGEAYPAGDQPFGHCWIRLDEYAVGHHVDSVDHLMERFPRKLERSISPPEPSTPGIDHVRCRCQPAARLADQHVDEGPALFLPIRVHPALGDLRASGDPAVRAAAFALFELGVLFLPPKPLAILLLHADSLSERWRACQGGNCKSRAHCLPHAGCCAPGSLTESGCTAPGVWLTAVAALQEHHFSSTVQYALSKNCFQLEYFASARRMLMTGLRLGFTGLVIRCICA